MLPGLDQHGQFQFASLTVVGAGADAYHVTVLHAQACCCRRRQARVVIPRHLGYRIGKLLEPRVQRVPAVEHGDCGIEYQREIAGGPWRSIFDDSDAPAIEIVHRRRRGLHRGIAPLHSLVPEGLEGLLLLVFFVLLAPRIDCLLPTLLHEFVGAVRLVHPCGEALYQWAGIPQGP